MRAPLGYQPPERDKGRLISHAVGCAVNGGPGLKPGVCRKCAERRHAYDKGLWRGRRTS